MKIKAFHDRFERDFYDITKKTKSNICWVTTQFLWPSHPSRTNYSQKLLKKIEAKICCVISEQTAYPPSATHPSLHRDTSFNELHDVKSRWKKTSRKSIDIKWFFLRPYINRRVLMLSYVFMSRKCQSEYDKTTFFAVVCDCHSLFSCFAHPITLISVFSNLVSLVW